jgi:putative FmdB family regulatory protein
MPTYEYVCEKCNHTFDLVQSITAAPLAHCPQDQCAQKRWGKGKVKRVIGAGAGLIFKGTGFYITDYRSEKYQQAAKKDSNPAPASSGSGSGGAPGSASAGSASSGATAGASDKPKPKPVSAAAPAKT